MKTFVLASAVSLSLFAALPALAEEHAPDSVPNYCTSRDVLVQALVDVFAERPIARGVGQDGMIEVFANPENPSWSIVLSMPNGVSCLVASGGRWQTVQQVASPGQPI